MTREYLTAYLLNNDCFPDQYCDVPEVSELWHNAINGEMCYVPYAEELTLTTYCHIFYELKVDPPKESGYDSDYAVYCSFRSSAIKADIKAANNN